MTGNGRKCEDDGIKPFSESHEGGDAQKLPRDHPRERDLARRGYKYIGMEETQSLLIIRGSISLRFYIVLSLLFLYAFAHFDISFIFAECCRLSVRRLR